MPSVTDFQQQSSKVSSNNNGKSTPPPPSLQQTNLTSTGTSNDPNNADAITQAVLVLEKKQRNLGKRKEKLESYEQEAKSGKELNKDQKEALSKYSEVIGQIECAKDICEQLKKIQAEFVKNQKRLAKQAAEEKRLLVAQRLREYAQLRYLLDHRPTSLKPEESSLLDELSRVIIPQDSSSNTITRSIDTVLSIYQGGPLSSIVKNLTGRTSQEIREILEQITKQSDAPVINETSTPQEIQITETVKQTPLVPQAPPTTPASVLPQREQIKQQNDAMGPSLSHSHVIETNPTEYPLKFDTRTQNIPLQQIIQDSPFFSLDQTNTNNNQQVKQETTINQDNNQIQSTDSKQYLQTFTIINSTLSSQQNVQGYSQTTSVATQPQAVNNYEQESSTNNISNDEQPPEEQWQHRRGNSGNVHRGGQYHEHANRNYNRGNAHNNYNQQNWRGQRGSGHYDGSYTGGQRQYNDNNRGGSGQRGAPNPNYRGNRGGNYRGGNRGGYAGNNGNGHPKSSQYQPGNEQLQQVRSAPSAHHS